MPNITVPLANFNNGQVEVSLRYNDSTLAINQFSVVNNSDYPCQITVKKAGVTAITRSFPANSTTIRNVSGIAFVIEAIDDEDDPYPEGESMHYGNMQIGCRWPN